MHVVGYKVVAVTGRLALAVGDVHGQRHVFVRQDVIANSWQRLKATIDPCYRLTLLPIGHGKILPKCKAKTAKKKKKNDRHRFNNDKRGEDTEDLRLSCNSYHMGLKGKLPQVSVFAV